MFLLIDNYDSFTYNIVHYLADLGVSVTVKRNDKINISQIQKLNPQAIFISPGPATPDQSGICLELITKLHATYPMLGICLGHQAIAQSFTAKIIKAPVPVHGKISDIIHNNTAIFKNIPSPFKATRYHSLIIDRKSLPKDFTISCTTKEDNIIMGIKHNKYPLEGIQFHPESIGTEYGKTIFKNFLDLYC